MNDILKKYLLVKLYFQALTFHQVALHPHEGCVHPRCVYLTRNNCFLF